MPKPNHQIKSATKDQISTVIGTLAKAEKKQLGPRWYYGDSQYKKVAVGEEEVPKGFIEVKVSGGSAHLNIATDPESRGQGVAKELIKTALHEVPIKYDKVKQFVWVTDKSNKASSHLAEQNGFSIGSEEGTEIKYNLSLAKGEMSSLGAMFSTMKVSDVPISPGVDINAIKNGDNDPLEVVVEIEPGVSKRGWNYLPSTMQSIVSQVMGETSPGFLGHQKAEDVGTEFKDPVTHWIGAKWENGKAYFRGVVDKAAPDLKRWIKSKRIGQVSIFGEAELAKVGEMTNVIGYKLMSIDWTPLNRNGMPTKVVATGEMEDFIEPGGNNNNGGGEQMTFTEVIAFLKQNKTSFSAIAGEMGVKPEDVAKELLGADYTQLQTAVLLVGEMSETLGVTPEKAGATLKSMIADKDQSVKLIGEMAVILGLDASKPDEMKTALTKMKSDQEASAVKLQGEMVDKVISELVAVEAVRPLIKRMVTVKSDATEAEIKTLVGEMIAQDDIKSLIGSSFQDKRFVPNGTDNQNSGLVTKRVSIV